jgi:hypothetical protein
VFFLNSFLSVLFALLLISCKTAPSRDPAIGEAFAGAASLSLHKDIDLKSPASAVVHHGDRLEIISRRRRWYRVRTARGAEGWTDDRALMDTGQMQRLLALAKNAAQLPSQGAASSFGMLNVHTEPNRLSASFVQVKEGDRFDVIAHRVVSRAPLPHRQLVVLKPKAEKKAKSKQKSSALPPPPPPTPPGPPPDWVALSKERAQVSEENLPPAARDDWTLIRTQGGQTGWVLTSRVYMAIPDEVAQYAEGHRITSYFKIGSVTDNGEQKPFWLWTTAVGLGEDHDFDGFRVFTWNTRRHRYETAYIQRRERGFFPVLAKAGEFSVCLEREDGTRVRKQYSMAGNAVRGAGDKPCGVTSADDDNSDGLPQLQVPETPTQKGGVWQNVKSAWKRLTSQSAPRP